MTSVIPKYGFKAEDLIKEGRTTKSKIEEIRKWLNYTTNIPPMSDEQIVLFLIACKNVTELTQITIESYFKQKHASPELFADRDVDNKENQFTHKVAHIVVFPKRTKENYVIAMGSLKDTTYYNFNIESQIKAAFALIDVFLHSDPPNGLIFIINIKGVGIMHLTRLKLGPLRKFFAYLQEALPTQLVRVHILNASYIFEKILAIAKPFMKKELFDLIIAHPPETDMEDFFEKHIPAHCMPADFGGDLPTMDQLSLDTQKRWRQVKSFLEAQEEQVRLYKNNK
ncbi:unnamed protein product [Phaedon cochleariae]|uniref:CRAL-TRIO domain-containing protein n=1 Tax=Phaedon cochleariae TaxID=80249 RepID=A0A9P0D9L7_PHACE|nr:unnamed protein product [Phaedon cochleariae]